MSDEAVKRQIEGVCSEISEKNGWTAFSVDTGSQWPIKLSTKLDAMIALGRAAGSNKAVWTFREVLGGENPNKPGTHFTNRYLEKVEVGGVLDPSKVPATSHAGVRSPEERHSIERQTVLKTCVPIRADFADDDALFAFMDRCAVFVEGGARPTAAVPPVPAPAPTPATSEGPYDESDVPF